VDERDLREAELERREQLKKIKNATSAARENVAGEPRVT